MTDVNDAPVLTPADPSLGGITAGDAATIDLATFINNGAGTTTVADVDQGAVVGGIALVGATGNGTWEYSLDGTTFQPVGAVADDSALLLPGDAVLRYTPSGTDSETATITYRAWDASSRRERDRWSTRRPAAAPRPSAPPSTPLRWPSTTRRSSRPAAPSLGTTDEDTTIVLADVHQQRRRHHDRHRRRTGTPCWVESPWSARPATEPGSIPSTARRSRPWARSRRVRRCCCPATPCCATRPTARTARRPASPTGRGTRPRRERQTMPTRRPTAAPRPSARPPTPASLTVTGLNDAPVLTRGLAFAGQHHLRYGDDDQPGDVHQQRLRDHRITDVDAGAVLGGIALTGTTGKRDLGVFARRHDLHRRRHGGRRRGAAAARRRHAALHARRQHRRDGDHHLPGVGHDRRRRAATTSTRRPTAAPRPSAPPPTPPELTVASGCLSGYVYLDTNNNGQKAASEAGLAGVTRPPHEPRTAAPSWTQTDAAGFYSFQGLAVGNVPNPGLPSSYMMTGQNTLGTVAERRGTVGQDTFQLSAGSGRRRQRVQLRHAGPPAVHGFLAAVPRLHAADAPGHRRTCTPRPPSASAAAATPAFGNVRYGTAAPVAIAAPRPRFPARTARRWPP